MIIFALRPNEWAQTGTVGVAETWLTLAIQLQVPLTGVQPIRAQLVATQTRLPAKAAPRPEARSGKVRPAAAALTIQNVLGILKIARAAAKPGHNANEMEACLMTTH